ncbi:Spo0E family sporulation regulatory protein-aspartic acid phosphatase [Clostridium intestinale]|uniref:Spo0E family sporulation regulatory protein-aspartic acid phosphatase n=1 Tax=Clostridium intestinale TaxID=36845 RepID=A0A7D6ZJ98_9CLOT|nr:Spo0E family sporulation regulatory protein-aspartic acid phosphatase [Clostridium intestinale]QLY81961.1 Spo0E family sporulation regulatory protein-aspartic acid phosphatase [Clostridium intestinale]
MKKEEIISTHIDILRERLEHLIEIKENNLIDEEVIYASNLLNEALNKYNNLVHNVKI